MWKRDSFQTMRILLRVSMNSPRMEGYHLGDERRRKRRGNGENKWRRRLLKQREVAMRKETRMIQKLSAMLCMMLLRYERECMASVGWRMRSGRDRGHLQRLHRYQR